MLQMEGGQDAVLERVVPRVLTEKVNYEDLKSRRLGIQISERRTVRVKSQ